MAASFSACRDGVAERLQTVSGLKKALAQIDDKVSDTPCAMVGPAPGDFVSYDPVMDTDDCDYALLVTVYVSAQNAVEAQQQIDAFLAPTGPTSIRAAINGRLGNLVANAKCTVGRNYRAEEIDGVRYLAIDFPVLVMT